jgi:hypothetical protein
MTNVGASVAAALLPRHFERREDVVAVAEIIAAVDESA